MSLPCCAQSSAVRPRMPSSNRRVVKHAPRAACRGERPRRRCTTPQRWYRTDDRFHREGSPPWALVCIGVRDATPNASTRPSPVLCFPSRLHFPLTQRPKPDGGTFSRIRQGICDDRRKNTRRASQADWSSWTSDRAACFAAWHGALVTQHASDTYNQVERCQTTF